MDYFGDVETLAEGCGRCDNCQTPDAMRRSMARRRKPCESCFREPRDWTADSAAASSPTWSSGSDTAQIRRYNHDELPTYGRLELDVQTAGSGDDSGTGSPGLSAPGGLALSGPGDHRRLGREVMHNRTIARLGTWEPASPKKTLRDRPATEPEAAVDPDPRARWIRARRLRRAALDGNPRKMGVPPYTLFWDRTLDATQHSGRAGRSLGNRRRKACKFGAEILAVIAGCTE